MLRSMGSQRVRDNFVNKQQLGKMYDIRQNYDLQFSSVTQLCPTLCNPMNRHTPGLPVHHQSWSLLKLRSIESVMPSSHLILCHHPLLLPPIPPSISVFSKESTLHMRWPRYWSFSFSISPSNEHPGLISFRMDWLDLLEDPVYIPNFLLVRYIKSTIWKGW